MKHVSVNELKTKIISTAISWERVLNVASTFSKLMICVLFQSLYRQFSIEWNKMWYVYMMEYYLAIRKNEIMPFAATWVDLEIIILSEVSQRDKYHMISLICGI